MGDEAPPPHVVADSLAVAVVVSSEAPTLLLDGDFAVVAASSSFSRAFQIPADAMVGRSVFALGAGEWGAPQLRTLLKLALNGDAGVDAYEMDLIRPGVAPRRLVVSARVLHYADPDNVRLLMAASDVTEARLAAKLKDDLLHEKTVLHQELQHRVANSLQIIASVLLQSARRVPSEDAKGYLVDAHSRVMSVAALQQQLAQSRAGDVALRAYFTELCASIGASMIQDHDKLVLRVEADDGVATADLSVSLGLIVTELVINALKHAFPPGQGGHIVVGYQSQTPDWALTVTDDGVGMPTNGQPTKVGLGTSIVHALATQVGATVEVTDGDPGTRVSIVHDGGAGGA
ncbi:sensor histidine kinase [Caulobacter sp. KR2-114]|uniref:sensor histidine kinase n=1 Tax=Caulobacter sp. KR2-114 TaxID=3400912 RepID=UPI003C02401A